MNLVVLSPHLDDAVLSCWHLLEGTHAVTVVNVFTGSPPAGTSPARWDRLTGARDPVARMRQRREEDRRALGLVGRTAVNLGLLDAEYGRVRSPIRPLLARLQRLRTPATVLYAPAALSRHPDHEVVRDAALDLAREGWRVVLYADLPHGIRHGWPVWVTGVPEPADIDVSGEWSSVLQDAGLPAERLVPHVWPLDDPVRRRKLRAVEEYRTQRTALDGLAFAPLRDARALAFEVTWRYRSTTASPAPRPAVRQSPCQVNDGGVAMSTAARVITAPEQTRACRPDREGYIERDGVRVFYEVYGKGAPTILLCPTWSLVHSRTWKMQIAYLARHHRVVVFDPRGNGRSDRPGTAGAYAESEFAQDALEVLDATGSEQAVVVGLSRGVQRTLLLAAEHPERISKVVSVGPLFPVSNTLGGVRYRVMSSRWVRPLFLRRPITTKGWSKFNAVHIRRDPSDFVEWFVSLCTCEPHSTKVFDDYIEWARGIDPDTLILTLLADWAAPVTRRDQLALARRVRCPVLVIGVTDDKVTPFADARLLARATGGRLVTIEGADHVPHARHPVKVNLAIREFVDPSFRREPTAHQPDRRRRALYISSPIGLGHARRDVAIARELRSIVGDLDIDWLAQDPVTRVLQAEGERIHPASRHLVNESAHLESESGEHDLHAFQAFRRMDEILTANFMVFNDVARDTRYDLWIGDEAWELDYHLHENPREKRAAFAWLTDFVGWLPMPDGGPREAFVAADYNAEMVEHVRDHPEVRDRAIFVGNPDDILDARLGDGLPLIRDWTERNFDFAGYVTGFDQAAIADRERLRADVGYAPQELVCLVTAGGSGVGADLLRRVIAAFPAAKAAVPQLRMIVVAGPRIAPASLPSLDGLEVHAYVHDLYRQLAASDLAVVQGGLATAMELTAARRPFLYFPLGHHFEQNFHVAHRLDRYRAGRRMDFAASTPEVIAVAIAEEIGRDVDYLPVETDGARKAAERIAELVN